jgi:periplasmic protein TonB
MIYEFVEQQPEFPGGQAEMMNYLKNNIIYPAEAKENQIQGTVYISVVVKKDGSLDDIKIVKGLSGGCSDEALRVVKNMPHWKPGKQNGKEVDVRVKIPVKFRLSD